MEPHPCRQWVWCGIILFFLPLSQGAFLSPEGISSRHHFLGKSLPNSYSHLSPSKVLASSSLDLDSLLRSIIPEYISTLLKDEEAKEEFLERLHDLDLRLHPPHPYQEDPSPCLSHFGLLFGKLSELLRNTSALVDPKNTWALHMLDSWGRFPTEGILSGHLNAYGDYDECVGVKVDGVLGPESDDDEFDGQYCWIYLLPIFGGDGESSTASPFGDPNGMIGVKKAGTVRDLVYNMDNPTATFVAPSNAFCVPSTCSSEEVQELLSLILSVPFPNLLPIPGFCVVKEDRTLDSGAKAMIGVLSTLAVLILVGSVLDVVSNSQEKLKDLTNNLGVRLLLAFSLPSNIRKWSNTSSGEGGFGCIHGIRFLSTCWVILSHTIFVVTMQGPVYNTIDINMIYKKPWHFFVMLNGYFAVDTFFTMSGLLACFTILKGLDKSRGSINIPSLYLHRYIRLTPTYGLIIGILANLFKYFGSGPFFSLTAEGIAESCRKYWWHNLLYFNNVYFYNEEKGEGMCEGESWYLANDMQFFILAPIFTFLLWKWTRIGMGVLGAASLASILAPGIVVGTEGLPATMIFWKSGTSPNARMYDVYYHPWYRIGPYLVGIWMGFFLYKLSKRSKSRPLTLPPLVVLGGWLLSTATAMAIIFGVIPYYDPLNDDNHTAAGFYGGLSRFCWGIVIVWVIFACVHGYGGWINGFLSWKAFVPLGRLTFCVYLSSLSVQYLFQLTLRQPMNFEMYHVTNMFFSHVTMCFLVGFVLSMTLESPFIALEKVIFGRRGSGGGGKSSAPEEKPEVFPTSGTIPRVKSINGNDISNGKQS